MPIILLALAVFIGVCFITKDQTGMLGSAISGVMLGLFSVGAYALPVLLAVHALFYTSDIKEKRIVSRVVFSALTILAISIFAHSVATWDIEISELPFNIPDFYLDGMNSVGGGFFGGILAFALMNFLGHVGVVILSLAIFAIYVAYFFSKGSAIKEVGRVIVYGILTFFVVIEKGVKKLFAPFKRSDTGRKNRKGMESNAELSNDDFFDVDNGIQHLEVSALGIAESRSREAVESNPTLHEKVYHSVEIDDIIDEVTAAEDFVYEAEAEEFTEETEPETVYTETAARPASDSADSIFTADFDPYSLAMSERLASKPSSRTFAEVKADEPKRTVTETIDDITPEQLERMRREEEFERRKREVIAEQRARDAARREAAEGARKSVEFHVQNAEVVTPERVESESVSVTIEKFDQAPERAPEPRIEYSSLEDIYSPSGTRAAYAPVSPEFKSYTVPVSEEKSDGLVFEFDTEPAETLTVERTMITASDNATRDEVDDVAPARSDEIITHELTFEADEDEDEDAPLEDTMPEDEYDVDDGEIPPEEQNPFITEARGMFDMFKREEPEEQTAPEEIDEPVVEEIEENDTEGEAAGAASPEIIEEDVEILDEDEEDEPPFEFLSNDGAVREIPTAEPPKKPEPPKKKAPDFSSYKLPPLDLLGLDPVHNEDQISDEIRENTRILIETLQSFGVTASIKGVDRGPRVTRYEVVPARGVKVHQVTHLFDDIKLALAAEGVRMEAPIPGRAAIGFEIPNKHPVNVRLRELLECEEFQSSTSTTYVSIGKDVAGNPVFGDIAKFPHALVAGATGMGKSVCINSILISMLYKSRPDEVRFILIDPKKVEFKVYSGIPHLLVPVVTEAKQAAGALMWAVEEMERRYDLIEKYNLRNIQAYNERVASDPSMGTPLSKIVIVIDELNDLMMQVRDPAEDLIMRIAQKARAAGIHLIIGTQRPDVKVITGTIKANIGTRISCKVTSVVDSRTILEMAGAEKLLNKGDMLYKPTDRTEPVRVQGCFVSDSEVEAVMEYIKQFATGEQYDEEVLAEINKAAQKCGKDKRGAQDSDDGGSEECGYYSDQQFLDAVELAIRSGKVSTSLLQRKLQIGFGKAARFIDAMEEIGIVSEPNGQKPRDVLLTMDEWREKLSRVEY